MTEQFTLNGPRPRFPCRAAWCSPIFCHVQRPNGGCRTLPLQQQNQVAGDPGLPPQRQTHVSGDPGLRGGLRLRKRECRADGALVLNFLKNRSFRLRTFENRKECGTHIWVRTRKSKPSGDAPPARWGLLIGNRSICELQSFALVPMCRPIYVDPPMPAGNE